MSTHAEVFRDSDLMDVPQETVKPQSTVFGGKAAWNPEDFAREQIRGLVRQIFFTSRIPPVKQVVFSAAEPQTDVAGICEKVGWALALETSASVAIVGCEPGSPTVEVQNRGRIS
ncbi:MAG: hypothetical protein WB562_10565, partial [Candidatus Sulfotelmatobacter sp.]